LKPTDNRTTKPLAGKALQVTETRFEMLLSAGYEFPESAMDNERNPPVVKVSLDSCTSSNGVSGLDPL
jgi:hypothetical protein